jgi:triacylglycerol lipase
MSQAGRALLIGLVITLLGLSIGLPVASAESDPPSPYPPSPAGPALETDDGALATALSCPVGFSHPDRAVALLVHGTGTTATESWPDGFGKALPRAGFDWCMVQLPDRALGDIQLSSEYVVSAVRSIANETGRKVDLIGHSQGAVEIRWAVRFWPDVRAEVDDLITLAGANDGVYAASTDCSLGHCSPASWQMRVGAALEAAVNQIPAPTGPSYTAIYSNSDVIIQPTSSATFSGASNVLVQDICPGRYVEHAWHLFDASVFAIALDAIDHVGPADAARVPRSACNEITAPGVDPTVAMADTATLGTNAAAAILSHPRTTSEPPLRDYALAG